MKTHAAVGVSGWRYPRWRGDFYPRELPQRHELAFIAERLTSLELNGSFHALQRPSSYRQWRREVPNDFVFAVKGPHEVTHTLRLSSARTALANFFASGVLALGPTLGPVLWQLPDTLDFDPALLDDFLTHLPRTTGEALALAHEHDERVADRTWLEIEADVPLRHAIDARSQTFADPRAAALLRDRGVSLVVADTAGRWPRFETLTADHVYVRLDGSRELYASGYLDAELDAWAARIRGWLDGSIADDRMPRDVYVFFGNDARGRAPYDAISLASRTG